MADKQTEALRLADELYCFRINDGSVLGAAAELRRLDALNAELVEALHGILYHFVPKKGNLKVENEMIKKAETALAKAGVDNV